ncbi:actin-related protein 6 isoform X2 [Tasmannia lanceolata]|uniref:actin-related protein 6 isoform X2 n=1 Tax=Tasmannia lanceolata TaxID=3420 RepID=UPI0040646D26
MSNVIVLDNGGGLCKAGIGGDRDPIAVVPNCLGRTPSSSSSKQKWLIADQLNSSSTTTTDLTSISLRRPFDRGYLINPDLQKEVWDRIFRSILRPHLDPTLSSLLLVEPLFNLPSIQRATDELVFEDFGFRSLYVADSPSLVHLYEASRRPDGLLSSTQCSLVVDSGFSFTHAAPVLQNFTLNYAVKRLDLGVKEKLCFVSLDVHRDLQLARGRGKDNLLKCTYVLPDGITHTKGFVKDPDEAQRYLTLPDGAPPPQPGMNEEMGHIEDVEKSEDRKRIDLTKNEFNLTNERFLVPEMIFHPADLGMNEAGLAECIVRAVNSCHPHLHPVLFESIILTGGSTLFPRFAERLKRELRPLVRDDYQVKITTQEDPIRGVWRGGSLLASSPDFESMCVTKSEYEELGSARCRRRFLH